MTQSSLSNHYEDIVSKFTIVSGKEVKIIKWGNGHINDTYRVITDDSDAPDYILQRINEDVFPEVEKLMSNQEAVIRHAANELFQPLVKVVSSEDDEKYLFRNEEGW